MNEYTLEISLSFNTQAEAKDIMAICEPLVIQTSEESKVLFINALKEQVDKEKKEAQDIFDSLIYGEKEYRNKLQFVYNLKSELTNLLEATKDEVTHFNDKINVVLERGTQTLKDLVDLQSQAENKLNEGYKKLDKLSVIKKEAQNLQEAISFLLDIKDATANIVTRGAVKLLQRENGKLKPVDGWQFERG